MEKIERDLRDMMQRQSGALHRTPTATRALVRRAQLRRVGTVALTGTFVLVLVLGGIGVGRSLLRDSAFPPAKPAPSGAHLSFLVPCIGCYPDSPSEPGLSTMDPEGSIKQLKAHEEVPSSCEGSADVCGIMDYAWSPDGSRVAILYGRVLDPLDGPALALYVMNADGSNLNRVATCPDVACDSFVPNRGGGGARVSWSPDGSKIALSDGGHVYLADVDGGGLERVTGCNSCAAAYPAWSPDGSSIAYSLGAPLDAEGLYAVDPDGSNRRRIAKVEQVWDPVWSPDGSQIAFFGVDGLYAVNQDGSDLRQPLVKLSGRGPTPSWSPDGERIAYLAGEGPSVWTVDADGGEKSLLYRAECCATDVGRPMWSPDGSEIAFSFELHTDPGSPGSGVFLMKSDGSEVRKLTEGSKPMWVPSG